MGQGEPADAGVVCRGSTGRGSRAARTGRHGDGAPATGYEDVKQARGVIDFEDVLLLTVGILEERDDIVRIVHGQYRQFVVDEYQDVNALQQRLLDLWLGERNDVRGRR